VESSAFSSLGDLRDSSNDKVSPLSSSECAALGIDGFAMMQTIQVR
jgi:hypothetical protein